MNCMGSELSNNSISFWSLKRFHYSNCSDQDGRFVSKHGHADLLLRSGLLCSFSGLFDFCSRISMQEAQAHAQERTSPCLGMCIHRCPATIHTYTACRALHFTETVWLEKMCKHCCFVFLCTQKYSRYRVSNHAASPKARLVHQGFHHPRHLHIIWPVVAGEIGNIINRNKTHTNITACLKFLLNPWASKLLMEYGPFVRSLIYGSQHVMSVAQKPCCSFDWH